MNQAVRDRLTKLIRTACVAEVLSPKAGNVHPGAAFDDAGWMDFVQSARASAPVLATAGVIGVGPAALEAVRATRQAVGHNTNLGMVLLLAPLSAAAWRCREGRLTTSSVQTVLDRLNEHDAQAVFTAIREAQPGGLGKAAKGDVRFPGSPGSPGTIGLVEAMSLASQRDAVARQYVSGFADVLRRLAPRLASLLKRGLAVDQAIMRLHLEQMAHEPDSLIRRKCGDDVAMESQQRAKRALALDEPETVSSRRAVAELDVWLRGEGHRRNPGTSADLVAAAMFAALCRGQAAWPLKWSRRLPRGMAKELA
ncbi:MAG: triphosphoribosyl-dephospho-CoA synthase [Phycisphaeraceae bacterium]|nr:triphosphoribosyl-dephospho-CoA synthase [Phycisphaeraceae bacterium]